MDISLSSHRWSPGSIPQKRQKVIVLLPREWPGQMMGEIMRFCIDDVSWILQNGRDWGCRNGEAGVCEETVEDGCDSLLMPVCGSVGGSGTSGSGMGYHGKLGYLPLLPPHLLPPLRSWLESLEHSDVFCRVVKLACGNDGLKLRWME